jgi:trigger factor
MKTTRKTISDTKIELTITLDGSELAAAEKVALGKLAQKIKVPGFRVGKVPVSVAARNVSASALMEQTLEDAVSKAVATAFINEGIQVLDRPQVDVKKLVPGQEVEFTAEAEIMPEVKLGDYKKLGVKKDSVKVEDKEVSDITDRMRQAFAERVEVKRVAKDGDEATIDYEGHKDSADGELFEGGTSQGYALQLGSNSFIPGFEEAIVGHKAGDEFDIPLTFPKEYHSAELAGAKVVFKVKLNKVTELKLPDIDDEFAKKAGPFTTAKELMADMRREIQTRKDSDATEKFKEALVDKLIDVSTVPVPDVLVHEQVHRIQDDVRQNLQYRGQTVEDYLAEKGYANEDEWHDSSEIRELAERRIKGGLALAELSKAENITASEEELDARHSEMLSQYSDPASQKQLSTPQARQEVANRLLTEKTIERLVELNLTKPKTASKK